MSDSPPDLQVHERSATRRGASPWTRAERLRMLLWSVTWTCLCSWTPKPANPLRLFVLKAFGAIIEGTPFVHQRARIQVPWHIKLGDGACLGDRSNLYSLGPIEIGPRTVIAQEAYLCAGSHDFAVPELPLVTARVIIGADAFIGARAFILPGVQIGDGTVVGAASVVVKNLPPWSFAAGNPCRVLRPREPHIFKNE
jgi:putative colanic acid biosynthesis acetyltransferase WcaF